MHNRVLDSHLPLRMREAKPHLHLPQSVSGAAVSGRSVLGPLHSRGEEGFHPVRRLFVHMEGGRGAQPPSFGALVHDFRRSSAAPSAKPRV